MKSSSASSPRVLIADDRKGLRLVLAALMRKNGFETLEAADGVTALHILRERSADVALLDIKMPRMSGMEVLREAKKFNCSPAIIVMTGFGSIKSAVEALKHGASDYLTKPLVLDEVLQATREGLKSGRRRESRSPTGRKESRLSLQESMGTSEQIRRVVAEIDLVAPTDFTALITGETGSGKEMLAEAIHRGSQRAGGPFVPVDCGSIVPTLVESELFGHEKGAFTGASQSRPGKFEVASGGTLFLDEIANLPLSVQPKLLRVLQERKVWRLGGRRPIEVDIRVVAATNQDLASMVQAGRFRRDLYYRLNEYYINLPPLRERPEDIVFLADFFLVATRKELQKDVRLTEAALERLLSYTWPGNVRELRNAIRRASLIADTHIQPQDLSLWHATAVPSHHLESVLEAAAGQLAGKVPFKNLVRDAVIQAETQIIGKMLKRTRGNKAEAARLLQIDYKTLHKKVKEYGISPKSAGQTESRRTTGKPRRAP